MNDLVLFVNVFDVDLFSFLRISDENVTMGSSSSSSLSNLSTPQALLSHFVRLIEQSLKSVGNALSGPITLRWI